MMSPAEMLAAHQETWDMPALAEQHPEVVAHLKERYEVHFGMCSDVIVVHKAEHRHESMFGPDGVPTTDVRVAVETLLSREAAK